MQPVAPVASWKEPSAHSWQISLRVPLAKLPLPHAVCSVEPRAAMWPGAAGVHCEAADRSVLFEEEPPSHGSGLDAPGSQ